MKKALTFLMVMCIAIALVAQTGTIAGKITDEEHLELPNAHVKLIHDGQLEQTEITNRNGNYEFANVSVGEYWLEITYTGFDTASYSKVSVSSGAITYLDHQLTAGIQLKTQYVYPDKPVDPGIPEVRHTLKPDQIKKMPATDFSGLISKVPTIYSKDDGDEINIAGSRSYSSGVYFDGIRINGSIQVPVAAIREINVITSGIPAKYGDVTGGIIEINTVRF